MNDNTFSPYSPGIDANLRYIMTYEYSLKKALWLAFYPVYTSLVFLPCAFLDWWPSLISFLYATLQLGPMWYFVYALIQIRETQIHTDDEKKSAWKSDLILWGCSIFSIAVVLIVYAYIFQWDPSGDMLTLMSFGGLAFFGILGAVLSMLCSCLGIRNVVRLNRIAKAYMTAKSSFYDIFGKPTLEFRPFSYDITNDIYFYKDKEELIYRGQIIPFGNIAGCEIMDTPTFYSDGIGSAVEIHGSGSSFIPFATSSITNTVHNYSLSISLVKMPEAVLTIEIGSNYLMVNKIMSEIKAIIK